MEWDKVADDKTIERTTNALKQRGFEVFVVDNKDQAKKKVLELIPKGAEVLNVASVTLQQIGIVEHIEESGDYEPLSAKIRAISDETERNRLRQLSLSPEYGVGSVHAVTEDGQIIDVSASGSQIPVYSYGATNLILVVGAQKIVKNLDEALKRVYEYVLPLESERVREAYKIPGSSVNMILILEKTRNARIKLIFVKEKLGF